MNNQNIICTWPRIRIPDACRDVEIVIGVDEAGRGPVLGSLIYCAAFWPVALHDEISGLGFNDSKQLSEANRDLLFSKMLNHPSIGWVIEELTAPYLSREMLRPTPISLNSISYDAVVRALQAIKDADSSYSYNGNNHDNMKNVKINALPPIINQIFIDTVGDPDYYKSKLVQGLGRDYGTFVIEKMWGRAGQDVVSTSNLMYGAGLVTGVAIGLNFGVERIAPATWKSKLGVSADKKSSLDLARELAQSEPDEVKWTKMFARKMDNNRAESYLIAKFGDKLVNGG